MKVLVQKFGGTSVASLEIRNKAVERVLEAKRQGYSVVVVVSAMGRIGDPYATDTLLSLLSPKLGTSFERERDMLMSCGEIISAVVMADAINQRGEACCVLTGGQAGIVTTDKAGDARILKIHPQRILEELALNKIVIVAGFQGVSQNGEITTLGRGGSDTTAAALGVALGAEAVDIFTDVEGIMTADPRLVEDARMLTHITYQEICQLAHEGAKVIHPRAVEIAMQRHIPMRVRSTFSPSEGTLITHGREGLESAIAFAPQRLITGITYTANVTQLIMRSQGDANWLVLEVLVFGALAELGISIDFINVSPSAIAFTVKDADAASAIKKLHSLKVKLEVREGCAKVAVVGVNMTGVPGVMAQVTEALAQEKIAILQSADSHTTIWCLVKKEDLHLAVKTLHRQFCLAEEERDLETV